MNTSKWKKVGVVGVDAGLVWIGDPCYVVSKDASHVFSSWKKFLSVLYEILPKEKGVSQFNYNHGGAGLGVCIDSPDGDGEFPVYAKYSSDGKLTQVMIKFN